MKIFLCITAILFVFTFQTNAQVADLKTTVELKETFVKSYNEAITKRFMLSRGELSPQGIVVLTNKADAEPGSRR